MHFLQGAAVKGIVGCRRFNAVVDFRGVMIHRRAAVGTDYGFFVTHNDMFSRP